MSRIRSGTPIFPTSCVELASLERFLVAGARAYLTKPLDVKQFLEVVDEVLADTP